MKFIKCILLVLLIAGPALAKGPRFSLWAPDGYPMIRETRSQAYVVIRPVSPDTPEILRVEKVSHFWLVHFFSGDAGTFHLIRHEEVAVFDTRTQAFHERTLEKSIQYKRDQEATKQVYGVQALEDFQRV